MNNHTQDSQSELDDIFNEHVENIQEGVVSAIQVGENVDYHTFDAKVELREAIEAYVTTRVKEELEKARSKDPHLCEFGHKVYSHKTVDGWCCACEADQAFMEAEIEARVKEAEELLRAEVNFYKDRCKMERNKYDILAKSTQEKVKEAEL